MNTEVKVSPVICHVTFFISTSHLKDRIYIVSFFPFVLLVLILYILAIFCLINVKNCFRKIVICVTDSNPFWFIIMRRLVTNICAIAVLQLLFFNSIQTESQDGINFCVPNLCHCVPDLIPIDISCDGIQLKSFWEESDWNVTLAALNLTGNEPLSVTFVGNEIEHIPVFSSINITMLLLQNNKIKSIESSAFSHLLSLELLNLAHNSLTADSLMEGIFFGQFKADSSGYFPMPLKHLNLSYNNIHRLAF